MVKENKTPNFFMIYRTRCQIIVHYKSYHLVASAREQANLPVFNNNESVMLIRKRERVYVCACERGRERVYAI